MRDKERTGSGARGPLVALPPWAARVLVALALELGVLAGLGGFTFHYAEGLSYFSTDPAACANCHIMWPQYDSWQKSSHHRVAACVDCHLPQSFVAKYIAKAENGYHHSVGFTFQNFHEPIMIKDKNQRILQANCVRCHDDLVHGLAAGAVEEAVSCVHCHSGVGHGPRAGLGGPDRGFEKELLLYGVHADE